MAPPIAPLRPRRLAVVSVMILAGALTGMVLLISPLPAAPAIDILENPAHATELADRYAASLLASDRTRAFDPDGHDQLAVVRAQVRNEPPSATVAFLLFDTARRHADGTVFPRWTAVFALILCFAGGAMGLWRARRAALVDPGPSISYESAGLAVAAMLVTTFLVGWTAVIVSTAVTTFTGFALGALIISGRVIPRSLAEPTTRRAHLRRIAIGLVLLGAGVAGRRLLAPAPDAGSAEILLRALPGLLATISLIFGVVVASTNIAVVFLYAPPDPAPAPADSLTKMPTKRGG